jgi:hypothetical protein
MTKLLTLSQVEIQNIARAVHPLLEDVLSEYDYRKYSADIYLKSKESFASLQPTNQGISDAMLWKWGHWGKENFPTHHKALIAEIQLGWPLFVKSSECQNPKNTFVWWQTYLKRSTTYITSAFITHLIHHKISLPIIDQHNYRAMNNLIAAQRPYFEYKKKPSKWEDIENLKHFMGAVSGYIDGISFSDFDKFLMMYGRGHVAR